VGLTGAAILRWTGDLLFPRPCPGCDVPLGTGHPGEFCAACTATLPWLRPPFCVICGDAFRVAAAGDAAIFADRLCGHCRETRPAYAVARAAFLYAGPVRHAIHHLKFDGWKATGPGFGALMVRAIGGAGGILEGIDLVAPVPLHVARLRERGFNQADVLARTIATAIHRPLVSGLLRRTRSTPPQVGLDRAARKENLRDAFEIGDQVEVAGGTILLVDDVMTTGATAHACARVLRKAGAADVRVAAFARD